MKCNIPENTSEIKCVNPGRPRNLSTAILNSGQPYQRPIKMSNVNKLIKQWNWLYFTPITVSLRNDVHNVVDGQNRISALRKMNNGKNVKIPCFIYTGMTYEQEAEMYYMWDKTTGHLKLPDSMRALLESRTNPQVTDINRRIERAGFTWALDKPNGTAYEIRSTRAVLEAYNLLGGQGFSRMLGLLAGAWHGVQPSLGSSIIAGMTLLLKNYEQELDDSTFILRLSAVDPREIIQLAHVDTPAVRYEQLLRRMYNEQGSGKELPVRYKV